MSEKSPPNKIAEYRMALGWTQEFLAEKAGLNFRTISAYERGERNNLVTLRKIARALGATVSNVLDDEAAQKMTADQLLSLAIEKISQELEKSDRKEHLKALLKIARKELESITKA